MDDFPKNLTEFETQFSTEDACVAYVRRHKWPEGFRCSRCTGRTSWTRRRRRVEKCTSCGHEESVTAGTMFHQTRKPLRLWFRAITLWVTSKRGISAKELSRQLDIHYETAWLWSHRLRATVTHAFGHQPLEGTVEVDEASLCGDRETASATAPGRLVAGAVEVRPLHLGRVRLAPVRNGVVPGPPEFVGSPSAQWLPGGNGGPTRSHVHMRRVFTLVRRVMLGTFHGSVSRKHLAAYLGEFQFRFNRRNATSRWLLFQRVISAAPLSPGVMMKSLTVPSLSQIQRTVERTRYARPH